MFAIEAVAEAMDEQVDRLLNESNWREPPVDAIELARRLGIQVLFDSRLPNRGRLARIRSGLVIYLRPGDRFEREQWTVAHELGEWLAPALLDPLEAADDLFREAWSSAFAARLLVPRRWWIEDDRTDLIALKARYVTASHEILAHRWLDDEEPVWVSIFDNGRLTRRRSNQGSLSRRLHPLEEHCLERCRRLERPVAEENAELWVRAWPIVEPGWRREILRATPFVDL